MAAKKKAAPPAPGAEATAPARVTKSRPARIRRYALKGTGFDAASRDGPRGRIWIPGDISPAQLARWNYDMLRRRARDVERQDAFLSSALDLQADFAIGSGIRPRIEDKDLQRLWEEQGNVIDPMGTCDIYGMQWMAFRSRQVGGDSFTRRRARRLSDGLPVPYQLELLESEFVPINDPLMRAGGLREVNGVLFDPLNRPAFYRMYRKHPSETDFTEGGEVLVPAADVAHMAHRSRPGQVRGCTVLANSIIRAKEVGEFMDATLVKMKIGSLIAGVLESDGEMADFADEDDREAGDGTTSDDGLQIHWQAGKLIQLPAGEKFKLVEPSDVGANYAVHLHWEFLAIAAAMGVPYEYLTGDLTGANERTLRVAGIKFRKRIMAWQRDIVRQWCRPVWGWFLDAAIASGAWEAPDEATLIKVSNPRWIVPGWESIRPLEDIRASGEAIRLGLTTLEDEQIARGLDPDDTLQEMANTNAKLDALGIVVDCDPRKVTKTGSGNGLDGTTPDG